MTPDIDVPALPLSNLNREALAKSSSPVQSGARWFWWIAARSLVNSISAHSNGGLHFVIGLGFTELSDSVFHNLPVVAYAIDAIAVIFFATIGFLARKGMIWAFFIGGILYTIDGGIFAYFGDWLPVAFHVYTLFWISRGVSALRTLLNSPRI